MHEDMTMVFPKIIRTRKWFCLFQSCLSHFCLVKLHPCYFEAITLTTSGGFQISCIWISAHSRNNSNGNSFAFEINGCESLISAEWASALSVFQHNLSYLQEMNIRKIWIDAHGTKFTIKQYAGHLAMFKYSVCQRKQKTSKHVCFLSTHLSLRQLLLVDLLDLGAVGQQVA